MNPIACPSCRQIMVKHSFGRNLGGEVNLDLCFTCQGIWFDDFETLQITPGGILDLFRLIHEHRDDLRQPLAQTLRCPRCEEGLVHGLDLTKLGGRFNYHRCLQRHGRFTTFSQFMIEKGFVRQLNRGEIHALAARVGSIRCSGCGAPVDIARNDACGHCKAPIAILDPAAVEQALARLQQAEVKRSAPPDFGKVADALVQQQSNNSTHSRKNRNQRQMDGLSGVADLLVAGAGLIVALLKN